MGGIIKPLTERQQKLVEDYYNQFGNRQIRKAIYRTTKGNPINFEMEDMISETYMAVHKAARNYNPNKGTKFSTFVEMNVQSFVKTKLTYQHRAKRAGDLDKRSLDEPVSMDEKGNKCTLGEILESDDGTDEILSGIKMYLDSLSFLQLEIVIMKLLGASQKGIADEFNISSGKFELIMHKISSDEKRKLFNMEAD